MLLPRNSQSHALDEPRLSWTELLSLPIISYPNQNSCFKQIEHYFSLAGYQFQPAEQVRESDTIVNLVAAGVGAAILPQLSVFHIPQSVTVHQLPQSLQRIVVVATPKNVDLSHAVWAFTDFIQQVDLS